MKRNNHQAPPLWNQHIRDKRYRLIITAIALVLAICWLAGAPASAAPAPSAKPLSPHWWQVLKATHIVVGRLVEISPGSLWVERNPGVYAFRIADVTLLKGQPLRKDVDITFSGKWPAEVKSGKPAKAIIEKLDSLRDQEIVVFVERWVFNPSRDHSGGERVFLLNHEPEDILRLTPSLREFLRAELRNQEAIATAFPASRAATKDKMHGAVKRFIDMMPRAKTVQKGIEGLEKLGPAAVPSIIRLMNDPRPLEQSPDLTAFRNRRDGKPTGTWADYESHNYARPEAIVEVLTNLLFYLTGKDFGYFVEGGTKEERRTAVHEAQVYLFYTLAQQK